MEKESLLHEEASLYKERTSSPQCISERQPHKDGKQSEDHEHDNKANKKGKIFQIPKRYILCFLVFLGFLLMNCERSCLSVAIVAMSSKRKVKVDGKWVTKAPEFHWDSKMKAMIHRILYSAIFWVSANIGTFTASSFFHVICHNSKGSCVILSAFFYGYLILQIPGGWLSLRIGSKRVLGYSILIASAIHTSLPIIVRYNCTLFVIARVIQGLALGVALPTNHVIWSYWSPAHEKSCLISFTVAGLSAGMLVAMPISGFLSVYGFSGGWPSVFYFFGIIGMSWFFLWNFFVSETPETHPTITKEEKQLILASRPHMDSSKKDSVPWVSMIKSRPVWAIMLAHFAFDCSYYTLLVCMPLFLRDVHKFNIATTGVLAALPWLFMSLMTLLGGCLADFLRKYMKTVYVRKILYVSGMAGSALFIILSGFPERSEIAVSFMCVAVAFFGLSFTGFMVNPLDIAPKYAGIIIGFSNCISTSPGFIGPSLVGIITRDEKASQWQLVFLVMGAISVVGIIIFIVFASGEIQPWASYYVDLADEEMENTSLNKSKSLENPLDEIR